MQLLLHCIFAKQKLYMKWTHIKWNDDIYDKIKQYGSENGISTFSGSLVYIVTQFFKFINRDK